MSLIKYIKKLFIKEDIQQEPYMDELHLSGLFVKNDIVALNDTWVTKSITGDIYCAKNIVVCKGVQIVGNINCRKCIVEGSVNGNISASEMIEIKENAVLNGNIIARKLDVSSTAVLNGYITTITVKDARQVYSDIKLKIDEIQHLNAEKENIIIENKEPEMVPVEAEEIKLKVEIPKNNIQPERPKPVVLEDNGKWW